jgi:hypothetical protein
LVDRQVHQTEKFFLLRLESLEFDDEVREVHSRESILEPAGGRCPSSQIVVN